MTRIFVSGASNELDRARRAMRLIVARGGKVTVDWTIAVEQLAHDGRQTSSMTDDDAYRAATLNILGLHASDALLFLAPRGTSRDSWVELGFALAMGIPVVCAGSAVRHSISTRLVPYFDDDAEAIAWLLDADRRSAEVTAS